MFGAALLVTRKHRRAKEVLRRRSQRVGIECACRTTAIRRTAIQAVVNAVILIVSVSMIIAYSRTLAMITLAVLSVHALVFLVSSRVNRRLQHRVMQANAEVQSALIEGVGIIGTIKRLGLEVFVEARVRRAYLELLRTGRLSTYFAIFTSTAADVLNRSFTLLVLWVGASAVLSGRLTPGELLASYALVGMLAPPVTAILMATRPMQEAVAAGERISDVLDAAPEDLLTGESLADAEPVVRFTNVSFGYPSRDPLLSGLSFTAERGCITGIVGHNGCGKSTIGALLLGLYRPSGGYVSIDNRDITTISKCALRRFVGVVPQQVERVSASILENICLGDQSPRSEVVASLCDDLGLSSALESLPRGLSTVIGERGVDISGGQAQLIAIARALYRQPDILFLDEATSALDAEAEQRLQKVLRGLATSGKCIIVVAHRMASVRNADTILVMSRGQLLEAGSHEQLLLNRGRYAALWTAQNAPRS